MKLISTTFCCLLFAATVHSQTLNWGNEVYGEVVDSTGAEVANTFLFELGAFDSGFTPTQLNINDWYSNWNIFDTATYDTGDDRFAGSEYMQKYSTTYPATPGVYSSNPSASTMSFAGLDAYIWVRGGTTPNSPVPGTEWLLVRASTWDFPAVGAECCDPSITEWSTASDLGTTSPLWGRQHDTRGPGEGIFDSGSYGPTSPTLQTFTFIPEPSGFLMSAVAAIGLLLRRRRPVVLD